MNSTLAHYSRENSQKLQLKKRKRTKRDIKCRRANKSYPNTHLVQVRHVFLSNYHLVLSLLKSKGIRIF